MAHVECRHCKERMYWSSSDRTQSVCGKCIAELEAKAVKLKELQDMWADYFNSPELFWHACDELLRAD